MVGGGDRGLHPSSVGLLGGHGPGGHQGERGAGVAGRKKPPADHPHPTVDGLLDYYSEAPMTRLGSVSPGCRERDAKSFFFPTKFSPF